MVSDGPQAEGRSPSEGPSKGPSKGPTGGPFGGAPTQLKRRMALAQYLLYQVRRSREAHYPGTSKKLDPHAGLPGGSPEEGTGGSAADIAAAGAEGLADALDPSVPVSVLLQSVSADDDAADDAASSSATEKAPMEARGRAGRAAAAVEPSWGALARETVAAAGRPPHEALELYLCERLLPVLDSALAALCRFVEQLQADERQYEQSLQQQQQHQQQQQQQEGAGGGHGPCLFLGHGLKSRFDPLVWLGQYLLRQGKAAEAYEKASCASSATAETKTPASSTGAAATDPWVRGEHLRHSELPYYWAIAEAVREERAWRALEALRPQTEQFVYTHIQRLQQEQQNEEEEETHHSTENVHQQQDEQQQQQQPSERCQLTAEDLPAVLQALDAAWGLEEHEGLFAAVFFAEDDGGTEDFSLPSSSRSSRPSARELHLQHSNRSSSSSNIVGACSNVPLEVADSSNITFAELWDFVAACLQRCPSLKQAIFEHALSSVSSTTTEQQQQKQQQKQEKRAEQQHTQKQVQEGKRRQEEREQQQQQQEQEADEGGQHLPADIEIRRGGSEGDNKDSDEEQQRQEQP
ncbi:hypothetical protein, conserved [Eimeria maxima]|uniref:Uncharacterized protein n=1 Tax=Eimeria maxima TaxID=5804 RepID=U6MF19_EIMMA|nr:hypothetical protein, conserved [Eimeria maxima]CDJ61034.1 hypothetical protein, conserved [Eimeria maxima]